MFSCHRQHSPFRCGFRYVNLIGGWCFRRNSKWTKDPYLGAGFGLSKYCLFDTNYLISSTCLCCYWEHRDWSPARNFKYKMCDKGEQTSYFKQKKLVESQKRSFKWHVIHTVFLDIFNQVIPYIFRIIRDYFARCRIVEDRRTNQNSYF